jgi:hypothetical protein
MIESWQPAALYGGLAVLVAILFYRWNKNPAFENFTILHAVANREGFYDPDRAHLTGTFLISSFFVVICVIRNAVDPQLVLLFGAYTSVFALKSAWNYTVSKRTDTDVKRAEINRGRRNDEPQSDDPTVEEEGQRPLRRRSTDSVFK